MTITNILRAADNYYASSLLDNNTTYPIEFDLSSKDDITKLGLKGKVPDDGTLEIYQDGTTFIEAMYDDIIYSKLPNETNITNITKNPKVIGDSTIWETDRNGTITNYNAIDVMPDFQFELFEGYGNLIYSYAIRSKDVEFDYTKSLRENIELLEESGNIDRSILPLELNKEIDFMLDLFNTESAISEAEALKLFTDNEKTIPNAVDYVIHMNDYSDPSQFKVWQVILNNIKNTDIVVVPNYVKHKDGTLEKITSIGRGACTSIGYRSDYTMGRDLIISYGIKEIGNVAFYMQGLNSVVIPSSVTKIGDGSFSLNMFTNIKLPYNLTYIGPDAFKHNKLTGEIIIPKNVTTIDFSAFTADRWTFTDEQCNNSGFSYLCQNMRYKNNEIEKVTFEAGSKIETISQSAFKWNKIQTITIPNSIKKIEGSAFTCDTLTSATIKRAKGSDLRIDSNAFGSVTPIYEP